ncbi:hypothetical protein Tco_1436347 [Tanacetum coccineum]
MHLVHIHEYILLDMSNNTIFNPNQFTSSNNIRRRQVEETVVEEADTSSTLGRRQGVIAGGSRHPVPADETKPRHRTSRCRFLRRRVAYLPVYRRCPPSGPVIYILPNMSNNTLFNHNQLPSLNNIIRRQVEEPAVEVDMSRSTLLERIVNMEQFGKVIRFVVVVVTQMSGSTGKRKNISLGLFGAIFAVCAMELWVMPYCKVKWKVIMFRIASHSTMLLALYLALCILKPEWLSQCRFVIVCITAIACTCSYELYVTRQNASALYQDIKTKFTWCCEKGVLVINYVIDKVLKPIRKDQPSPTSALDPHASV